MSEPSNTDDRIVTPEIPSSTSKADRFRKRLTTFNIIVACALAVSLFAHWRFESPFVFLSLMFLGLLTPLLFAANIGAIFTLWKKCRFHAFYPLFTQVLVIGLLFVTGQFTSRLVMYGLPSEPNSYFTSATRLELTEIANKLLGHSYKEIWVLNENENSADIEMIVGDPIERLPAVLEQKLRKLRIRAVSVDDTQSLVVFRANHMRTWFEYLYSPKELLPLYSRPASFTETDIVSWLELIDIVKQGAHATPEERNHVVFEPEIAYPYLEKALGSAVMARMRGYVVEREITPEDKAAVLAALNAQRMMTSRLVEDPNITFDPIVDFEGGIDFAGGYEISGSFWVSRLIEQLLMQGVLSYAEDHRHLKIKENLTVDEAQAVEWVHIGLINFIYGNLVKKEERAYERSFGDGWYFNQRESLS